MRRVTYSLSTSLDGYIVDPDGSIDWSTPSDELFRFATEEVRGLAVHLMGRRLYETMLYWETAAEDPDLDDDTRTWIEVWNPLPKVVFSSTLTEVRGNARLASGSLAEEIERLRAEPGDGDIGIGGATLAAEAVSADLIDEFRIRVHPVLLGGGIPYFPRDGRRVQLELLESRTFADQVLYQRHRVVR